MKKKKGLGTGNHKKNLVILYLLLIVLEILLYPRIIYDRQEESQYFQADGIESYVGYDVDGAVFVRTAEDSFITVAGEFTEAGQVTVELAASLKERLPVRIYYARKSGDYSEARSVSYSFGPGEDTCVMELPEGNYQSLRIDLDGDFILKQISVTGKQLQKNPWRLGADILVLFVLLVLIWQKGEGFTERCLKPCARRIRTALERLYTGGRQRGVRAEKVFAVLALVAGCLFSVLIPPGQSPDEESHYSFMTAEFGCPQLSAQISGYLRDIRFDDIYSRPENRQDMQLMQSHRKDRFSYQDMSFHGISIKLLGHLPMGICFFLGVLLHLPIIFCLQLSEIGAVLFFAYMGYQTLKLLPAKKELMSAVMLLPMTVQQCSSVSYDAVILPFSFFMTAYLFSMMYVREKLYWRDAAVLLLFFVTMAVTKPVYILILFVILLIPLEKWELKAGASHNIMDDLKKHRIGLICVLCILAAAGIYLFRDNMYLKLLLSCMVGFKQFLIVLFNTLKTYLDMYWRETIAVFGWLDTYAPSGLYWFVTAMVFIFSQSAIEITGKTYQLSWKERTVYFLVFVLCALLTVIIMFTWSYQLNQFDLSAGLKGYVEYLKSISLSLGVQGRYFIPVLFFLFLALHGIRKIKKEILFGLQMVYYPVLFIWCIRILSSRYWLG